MAGMDMFSISENFAPHDTMVTLLNVNLGGIMPPALENRGNTIYTPFVPYILEKRYQRSHRGEDALKEETTVTDRLRLCDLLHEHDRSNPFWPNAKTFFSLWPGDVNATLQHIESMGITCGKNRMITITNEEQWRSLPQPWEFMELPGSPLLEGASAELIALVAAAGRDSEKGYRRIKDILTVESGHPSLLIEPVVNETLRACERSGSRNVCVTGMSEDDVWAYKGKNVKLVGVNKWNSPELEKMIAPDRQDVIVLTPKPGEIIGPDELTTEKPYLIQMDITKEEIPLKNHSFVVEGNYVAHHILRTYLLTFLHKIVQISAPIGTSGTEHAFILGEDSRFWDLLLIKLGRNWPVTALDAITSQVGSYFTEEILQKYAPDLKKDGISLHVKNSPNMPLIIQRSPFVRYGMPVAQRIYTGYSPKL